MAASLCLGFSFCLFVLACVCLHKLEILIQLDSDAMHSNPIIHINIQSVAYLVCSTPFDGKSKKGLRVEFYAPGRFYTAVNQKRAVCLQQEFYMEWKRGRGLVEAKQTKQLPQKSRN